MASPYQYQYRLTAFDEATQRHRPWPPSPTLTKNQSNPRCPVILIALPLFILMTAAPLLSAIFRPHTQLQSRSVHAMRTVQHTARDNSHVVYPAPVASELAPQVFDQPSRPFVPASTCSSRDISLWTTHSWLLSLAPYCPSHLSYPCVNTTTAVSDAAPFDVDTESCKSEVLAALLWSQEGSANEPSSMVSSNGNSSGLDRIGVCMIEGSTTLHSSPGMLLPLACVPFSSWWTTCSMCVDRSPSAVCTPDPQPILQCAEYGYYARAAAAAARQHPRGTHEVGLSSG